MAVYQKDRKRDPFQDLMTILGIGAQAYGAWNQGQQFQQLRGDEAAEGAATRAHEMELLEKQAGMGREQADERFVETMLKGDFRLDPTRAPQYRPPSEPAAPFTGEPDADLGRAPSFRSPGFTPDPSRQRPVGQARMGMWSRPTEQERYETQRQYDIDNPVPPSAIDAARTRNLDMQTSLMGREATGGGGTARPDMPKLRDDAANYADTKMSIHYPWYGKDQSLFPDITPEQRFEADAAYDNFAEMYMQQYGGGTRGPDVSGMSLLAAGLVAGEPEAEEALDVLVAEAPGVLPDLKRQIDTIQQIKSVAVPPGFGTSPIDFAGAGGSSTYSQTAPSNTMQSNMAAKQARLAELNQQLSQIYDPSLAWERDRIMKEMGSLNG